MDNNDQYYTQDQRWKVWFAWYPVWTIQPKGYAKRRWLRWVERFHLGSVVLSNFGYVYREIIHPE